VPRIPARFASGFFAAQLIFWRFGQMRARHEPINFTSRFHAPPKVHKMLSRRAHRPEAHRGTRAPCSDDASYANLTRRNLLNDISLALFTSAVQKVALLFSNKYSSFQQTFSKSLVQKSNLCYIIFTCTCLITSI
jgi:hypothetical protein